DGHHALCLVFPETLARANLPPAASDAPEEVYNIGGGPEPSRVDLAEALQRAMGSERPLEFGPPRGVNAVSRRLSDISRARQRLGWKPEVDLDEGLRRLVAWWRAERVAGSEVGAE